MGKELRVCWAFLATLLLVSASGFDVPKMVGQGEWSRRISPRSGATSLRAQLRGGGGAGDGRPDGYKGPIITEVSKLPTFRRTEAF